MASARSKAHLGHGLHSRFHSPKSAKMSTRTLPDAASAVQQLARRATETSYSSSSSISPTIPIAVGVAVPLVIIIVAFIYLHRRHMKKLQQEERQDPHKSLDFGLGDKGSRKGAEMSQADLEKSLALHGRGLSLDAIGNPYLLPPEVHNSRESLNSLSRSIVHGSHDPYKITAFSPTASQYRTGSKLQDDDASTRTGSTINGFRQEGMNSNLLQNAQKMPSGPPGARGLEAIGEHHHDRSRTSPPPDVHEMATLSSPQSMNAPMAIGHHADVVSGHVPGGQVAMAHSSPPAAYATPQVPAITVEEDHFAEFSNPGSPQLASNLSSPMNPSTPFYTPTEEHHQEPVLQGLGVSNIPLDSRRLSVLRPLPPDDPHDNAEQRANRIRSFYKEYFNENEPARAYEASADYYEDYGQEYLGDGAIYDPDSNQFIVAQAPYAEPVTRRAMTPPPRGPPRFRGGPGPGPGPRSSSGSHGGPRPPRARAFSSASTSRMGPGPRGPKRPVPPPAPLRTLPTPHLLKEDAFVLPIDFAPPSSYRDRAAGRPDSPLGQSRPFSPQVPIASSPLASSFNELPAMPSPHALRKSGTFTALDFAPPPRFRNADSASDAGSIRSNRSAASARQVHNIRAGAYRVSRIPKDLVGTSNEFTESLKPTWKVGS